METKGRKFRILKFGVLGFWGSWGSGWVWGLGLGFRPRRAAGFLSLGFRRHQGFCFFCFFLGFIGFRIWDLGLYKAFRVCDLEVFQFPCLGLTCLGFRRVWG